MRQIWLLAFLAAGSAWANEEKICEPGFNAFTTTVLPALRNGPCVDCHTPGAHPRAPSYLAINPVDAYFMVQNYVDFNDSEHSRLEVRAGSGHCKLCDLPQRAIIQEEVRAWWDGGQSQCAAITYKNTLPLKIPADLPSDRFVKMSWNLREIDVNLQEVNLTLEIKRFRAALLNGQAAEAYALRKPRIETPRNEVIQIKGLRVLMNRHFQWFANAFERIDTHVSGAMNPDNTLSFPVLSPETIIILEEKPGADELSLAIEKVGLATKQPCVASTVFATEVLPSIQKNSCVTCHSNKGTAGKFLNMELKPDDLCTKLKEYTWKTPDVFPALVYYPLQGHGLGHPDTSLQMNDVNPRWMNWIKKEH